MRYLAICIALMLSACGPMYANTAYPAYPVYRPMQLPSVNQTMPMPRNYSVMTPGGLHNCTDYGNGTVQCF